MADSVAGENWKRYTYVLGKGHNVYIFRAARLEGFYLGGDIDEHGILMGGGQWNEEDLAVLADQGRPAYECNEIRGAINSAVGYQIYNRMDITFRPAGSGSDQELADIRSKLAMFIMGQEQFHYKETQVFTDGIVEQRGYYNIKVKFTDNVQGDASIEVLDPRDVIPDPDAKGYDPETWADVTISRWLTIDEIEENYGKDKRKEVEASGMNSGSEGDFGQGESSGPRNTFGNAELINGGYQDIAGTKRVRVIDRQKYKYAMTKVAIHPTGDIQVIEGSAEDVIADLIAKGCILNKRMTKRVHWSVSTRTVTLFDDWSPFPWFTVLPFFPYFRRGKTRGMVDIAVGPQQILNKAVSQEVHIVNLSANPGWVIEEGSLTNMETENMEEVGAQSGLILEVKRGSEKPARIQPGQVPSGIDLLIQRSLETIKNVTVPDAMRGSKGAEVSGVAIQSKQFASQQQLAVPLDNLAYTRNILATRLDWIIANYYDAERGVRITETEAMSGKDSTTEIIINQPDGMGGYANDMTIGKYDVVVAEVPMQITYENSQFTQALEIRKAGIAVPDWAVIKHSNLSDKGEILQEMRQPTEVDPTLEAKAKLIEAQTRKADADTKVLSAQAVLTGTQAQFSAIQAGQLITSVPQISPVADAVLANAGYQPPNPKGVDPDLPVPQGIGAMPQNNVPLAVQQNTSPQFPAVTGQPESALTGIETARNEGIRI